MCVMLVINQAAVWKATAIIKFFFLFSKIHVGAISTTTHKLFKKFPALRITL